jgi:hypothetical protein
MRLLIILAVVAGLSSSVDAEEFVIRFDEVGFDDVAADVEDPEIKVFRSFELLATIDSRFAVRTADAKDGVTVRGLLKQGKEGPYALEFAYTVLSSQEDTPRKAQWRLNSTVALRVDEQVEVGGVLDKRRSAKRPDERHSKWALAITISKPADVW